MINPLNQSPGQTEKVPGNRKRPGQRFIYRYIVPVLFYYLKQTVCCEREVRVGAVRVVSTGGSSCGVFQSLHGMGLTSHIACKLLAQNA